ncbi:MAG: hypothetical protein SFU86_16800 [Pirellulaceae bacterium]|nr:hypothetical protein [Pirellulaceae bacterium]
MSLHEPETNSPGQITAPQLPKQSTRAIRPHLAAWLLLILWLAIDLGVIVYWARGEWGFLGDLGIIIGYGGNIFGLVGWLVAWGVLANWRLRWRAAYAGVGFAALGAITAPLDPWWKLEDRLAWAVLVVAVAIGTILVLVRRWGWRICLPPHDTPGPDRWQFSIGDLLWTTTGTALVLALGSYWPVDNWEEIVILAWLVLAVTVVLLLGLGARHFWLAAPVSLASCAALGALAIGIVDVEELRRPQDLLMVGIFGLPAIAPPLLLIGLLRLHGWRLRRTAA